MRMEIDYSVLSEYFNFSGYIHSFYSPHFSINYEKNQDSLSIFLTSYPRKINLISLKLYLKLQDTLSPIFNFDISNMPFESQIIFKSGELFHSFYSTDEGNGITDFSFSKGYLIINKKFCGKTLLKGVNKILCLKESQGTLIEIFGNHSLKFLSPNSDLKKSVWAFTKFRKKTMLENDYSKNVNKVLNSIMIPDYVFLDGLSGFPDYSSKDILNIIESFDSNGVSAAITAPSFFVKRNDGMYEKFLNDAVDPHFRDKQYKDFVILNPDNKEFLEFFSDKVFEYLNSGISVIRFENLYPLMKFCEYKWKILTFLKDLITSIKSKFPQTKLIADIPPKHFSYNIDFFELQTYIKARGTFFKSWKIDRFSSIRTIFSMLSNFTKYNLLLPIPSFVMDNFSDDERYFVSIINYIFSSMIFFDRLASSYSREEITISKKMIKISPNITDINYNDGVFRIKFFTDEEFILYINLGKESLNINSFKIKPYSLSIFDTDNILRKWPFKGW